MSYVDLRYVVVSTQSYVCLYAFHFSLLGIDSAMYNDVVIQSLECELKMSMNCLKST